MKIRRIIAFAIIMSCTLSARAQIYDAGNDPASARYLQISTPRFDVIYPRGADSLARCYAISLERQAPLVGASIGFDPNECCTRRMPVILHGYTPFANGMVMWGPRRMELYTVGDALSPEPLPWMLNLTTHESRHASQLQFARKGWMKVPRVLLGDLSDVAWWAVYTGILFSEGDAVVAETALTGHGRGRNADFLEYVRAAFDQGDMRDFYKWRFGSNRHFAPDHYRAGYMLVAGTRYTWDDPLFTSRYYSNIASAKLPVLNLKKTIRQVSGKGFNDSWDEIADSFASIWEQDRQERGPFMQGTRLTAVPKRFEDIQGATAIGDDIYAVRNGMASGRRLVRISPDGETQVIRPWASSCSVLRAHGDTLYWSEVHVGPRWELGGSSVIRSMDVQSRSIRTLLRGGRYYNPAPSPDGSMLSVTHYPLDGSTHLIVISSRDGSELRRMKAPDGMQIVESTWIGERIYVSAITEAGTGIYEATDGFRTVLPGISTKIKQLCTRDGALNFVCDRSGVNELYSYDGSTLTRLSNTRNGAEGFVFDSDGDTVRYTVLQSEGRIYHSMPASSLPAAAESWSSVHRHPIADTLSAQERRLGTVAPDASEIEVSAPRSYRKAAHLVKFHSWAPLYVDYDKIATLSFEAMQNAAGLGATAFFQNDLSTMKGVASYHAAPGEEGRWRHSGHLTLDYTGWYPVIESSLDIGDSDAGMYHLMLTHKGGEQGHSVYMIRRSGMPSVNLSTMVYVPLSFSSGGWLRGVVPQLQYAVSNYVFDSSTTEMQAYDLSQEGAQIRSFMGYTPAARPLMQSLSASVRAYTMLPVAPSGVYPKWGIGAEAGINLRPGLTRLYAPVTYAYLYGYLPGIVPQHGLRLSGIVQKLSSGGLFAEQRINTCPRGIAATAALNQQLAGRYPVQARMTSDYLMAVLPVDWSGLGPVAYVRNFELGLHHDCTLLGGRDGLGMLNSTGVSLTARLGNLLWVPFDTRIGVSYSYNGGPSFDEFKNGGILAGGHHHIGMTMSVDY